MDSVFRALGDPRRRDILLLIGAGELRAGEIASHYGDVTRPAISQHLRVLVDAGVLSERREGTRRFYRVRVEGLESIAEFLDRFWNERLRRLKQTAEAEQRRKQKENDRGNQ
jgi:DNA-binding transcriptional ArsR family regulator